MSLNIKWSKYIPADKKPTPKQMAFLSLPHQEAFYGGAAGGGKGLIPQGKVLTPTGFKEIQSLGVGSSICATDGTVCTILNKWERGPQQTYKLTFHTGTEIICDEDHIWLGWRAGKSAKRANVRSHAHDAIRKWSTRELYKTFKDNPEKNPFRIPTISAPVSYNVAGSLYGKGNFVRREISPYVLGVLLGDGCLMGGHLDFCSADPEIPMEVEKELGAPLKHYKNESKSAQSYRIPSGWFEHLNTLGLMGKYSYEKFIPRIYKLASPEERLSLLQGLMDTDGWADKDGDIYYCSTSKQLAEDVMEVARSLGAICTFRSKIPTYTYLDEKKEGREAYTIRIKTTDNSKFFRLPRKIATASSSEPNTMSLGLASIEKLDVQPTICIEVSHPNSLFITNDFIVTHNSECLLMGALAWCDTPGFSGIIFRRQYTDMLLPSSILSRCKEWLAPFLKTKEVKYDKGTHSFLFPSGAKLAFGYLKAEGVKNRYASSEYHYIAFDELTHFMEDEYTFLFSRQRKTTATEHIPLKMRSASNPGAIGHLWVKKRFGIVKDEKTGEFYGTNPDAPFISARVSDNPYIDQTYMKTLDKLGKVERERLKNGDWDVSDQALFDNFWFTNRWLSKSNGLNTWYHLYTIDGLQTYMDNEIRYFSTIDCAASLKTGVRGLSYIKDKQPSWSVIATWGLTPKFDLLWLDNWRAQVSIPDLVNAIEDNQRKWNPLYNIIEKNGPGEGVYANALLRGLPCKPISTAHDKIQNSIAAQLRAEDGKIWLPAFTPWLRDLEDELFTWSGNQNQPDDQVDVLSNAANEAMELSVGYERDLTLRSGTKRAIPRSTGGMSAKRGIGGREGAYILGRGATSGLGYLRGK